MAAAASRLLTWNRDCPALMLSPTFSFRLTICPATGAKIRAIRSSLKLSFPVAVRIEGVTFSLSSSTLMLAIILGSNLTTASLGGKSVLLCTDVLAGDSADDEDTFEPAERCSQPMAKKQIRTPSQS